LRLRALPATSHEDRGDVQDVLAALRELRPDDQEILRLAAWEGLTTRELAAALGCSENAVSGASRSR